MNARYRVAVPCFCCMLLTIAAGAFAEDFAIRLSHPSKVGERTSLSGSSRVDEEMVVTVSGNESRQEKHATYRFAVTHTVLAVSARGNCSQAELTVQKLTREADGAITSPLKAGDVLSVRLKGAENVWELGGVPVAADVKEALLDVAAVEADDEPSDDEVFGTARRRSVGDTWPPNGELIAKRLAREGTSMTAKDVIGTVTLAGKRSLQGQPSLEVRLDLSVSGTIHSAELPGMEIVGRLRMTGTQVVPVDGARSRLGEDELEMKMSMTSNGTINGVPMTLRGEMRRASNVQRSPAR
jgi:hypothetical protein